MKEKKKIVIIGASYLQLPIIMKAKSMGLETHVFAWKYGADGEKEADYFYPISIRDKEEILKECKLIHPDGVVSIASDLAMDTVNYIASGLKLVCNSSESVTLSTNKYSMRNALKNNGDPVPEFRLLSENNISDIEELSLPLIIKPTDRSGSRGVTKIIDKSEIIDAVTRALDISFEKKVIAEEFLEGKEYSVEGISYHGKHEIIAFTEKFTTGFPYYIETAHMEPAGIDSELKIKIKEMLCHAFNSLKIENGATHSEIKIDEQGNIGIIEIANRMGGDFIGSDLVPYSTGIDYMRAVIDIALGNFPNINPISDIKRKVKIQYVLSEDDVKLYESIKNNEPERMLKVINYNPENIGKFADSSERNAGAFIYVL